MPPRSSPDESVKRLLPWLVAVAFFMESLDTTILNTAVPTISAALGVAPLSMKAVLASYTLSLAVLRAGDIRRARTELGGDGGAAGVVPGAARRIRAPCEDTIVAVTAAQTV